MAGLKSKRPGVSSGGSNGGGQKPLLNLLSALGSYDSNMQINPGQEAQGPPTAEGASPQGVDASVSIAKPSFWNNLLDRHGVDAAEQLKNQFAIQQFLAKQQAAKDLQHVQVQGGNARVLENERFGHEQVLGQQKSEAEIKAAQAKEAAQALREANVAGYPSVEAWINSRQPIINLQSKLQANDLNAKLGIDPQIYSQAVQKGALADLEKQDALNQENLAKAAYENSQAKYAPFMKIPSGDALVNVDTGSNIYNVAAHPELGLKGGPVGAIQTPTVSFGGGRPVATPGGVNGKITGATVTPPKVNIPVAPNPQSQSQTPSITNPTLDTSRLGEDWGGIINSIPLLQDFFKRQGMFSTPSQY